MANDNSPRGLSPVAHLSGAPYNGMVNRYFVPAAETNNIFPGDLVRSGTTTDPDGVPSIVKAAAGDVVLGVMVSVEPETSESPMYREASKDSYIYVADAPDLVFEVQEDSVGGSLGVGFSGINNNVDIVVGTGSTLRATSGAQLDSSTVTSSTAQLKLLGLAQRADNELGTNANWLVTINEHERG